METVTISKKEYDRLKKLYVDLDDDVLKQIKSSIADIKNGRFTIE